MIKSFILFFLITSVCYTELTYSADNLKLNPNLSYNSDSDDGPLITGDNLEGGKIHPGRPAHIIFYQRECYNSKRQAKRTVELYEKYKDSVDFIIIDVDSLKSKDQVSLEQKYYKRYIPHITVIDRNGHAVYNSSGEIRTDRLSKILDKVLTEEN